MVISFVTETSQSLLLSLLYPTVIVVARTLIESVGGGGSSGRRPMRTMRSSCWACATDNESMNCVGRWDDTVLVLDVNIGSTANHVTNHEQ